MGDTRIQAILEAEPGILLLGTEGGLHIVNMPKGKVDHLYHEAGNINSLEANGIQSNAFLLDSLGRLWLGIWSAGLNMIEFTGPGCTDPVFHHWKNEAGNTNSLNNDNVISLNMTKDGILWIGTFGGGLNRFNHAIEEFRAYTTVDGLPNNIIYSILEDKSGNLWMSTDKGISSFNPVRETFQNYFYTDGLQSDHFFWGASAKSKSGEFYFGGVSGLNSFVPENISFKVQEAKPVFIDISVFNESIAQDTAIPYMDHINLSYNQNRISFAFSALNYVNPGKVLYRYYLEGVDESYINGTQWRNAEYSNLDPGTYTFHLGVVDTQDYTRMNTVDFRINISRPWWRTTWAVILAIFLSVATLLGVYYLRFAVLERQKRKLAGQIRERTREISEKNKQLQETLDKLGNAKDQLVEAEKMASLGILSAGVAHEINNPLNFIQGGVTGLERYLSELPEGLSEDQKILFEAIKQGVERVSSIVSSLNQFSRRGESISEICHIHEILDNCLMILMNELKNKVEVSRDYTHGDLIVTGNSGKLHQAFLNLITNASHAIETSGTILLKTALEKDMVRITITDDGSGISKENLVRITDPFFTTKDPGKGTGLGLSIVYSIILEHKGTINFESEPGKGTTVTILIPGLIKTSIDTIIS